MSFGDPFAIAQSGSRYAEAAMAVSVGNITSANTEGRTVHSIKAQSSIVNGVPLGLEFGAPNRDVDSNQLEDLRLKSTIAGKFSKANDLYSLIDYHLGTPGDGQDLGSDLTRIKAALVTAVNGPDQPWAQNDVVKYFKQAADKINDLGNFYQQQRMFAENDILDAVNQINSYVTQIHDVNKQATIAARSGGSAPDYEDQQDVLLRQLSELINVQVYKDDKGSMRITTSSGRALLVADKIYPLSFNPSTIITATTNPATLPQIVCDGYNINGDISSGALKSLIEWRDTKITNEYQAPLDELATQLRDTMNAIHNRGVGFPPRQNITGERAFTTPLVSTIQMSGQVRIALVDRTTGMFAAGINPLDLDLTAAPVTISAMVNQMNTHFSTGGFGNVTLNASGQLNLAATNPNFGFAIVSLGNPAGQVTYDDTGGAPVNTGCEFSHFFGLNNIITSGTRQISDGNASKAGISQLMDVRSDILATPALLSRGTLYAGALPTVSHALTPGQNDIIITIKEAFENRIGFAPAGVFASGLTETFADYANTLYHTHAMTALFTKNSSESTQMIYNQTLEQFTAATGVNTTEEMNKILDLQFFNTMCLKCIEIVNKTRNELLNVIHA